MFFITNKILNYNNINTIYDRFFTFNQDFFTSHVRIVKNSSSFLKKFSNRMLFFWQPCSLFILTLSLKQTIKTQTKIEVNNRGTTQSAHFEYTH